MNKDNSAIASKALHRRARAYDHLDRHPEALSDYVKVRSSFLCWSERPSASKCWVERPSASLWEKWDPGPRLGTRRLPAKNWGGGYVQLLRETGRPAGRQNEVGLGVWGGDNMAWKGLECCGWVAGYRGCVLSPTAREERCAFTGLLSTLLFSMSSLWILLLWVRMVLLCAHVDNCHHNRLQHGPPVS